MISMVPRGINSGYFITYLFNVITIRRYLMCGRYYIDDETSKEI